LHWFEGNLSHIRRGVSAGPDQLENLSIFFQRVDSVIAVQLNKILDREGHLFSGRFRIEPCLDHNAAEQKLLYSITFRIWPPLANPNAKRESEKRFDPFMSIRPKLHA
jgi:hypothetical protein